MYNYKKVKEAAKLFMQVCKSEKIPYVLITDNNDTFNIVSSMSQSTFNTILRNIVNKVRESQNWEVDDPSFKLIHEGIIDVFAHGLMPVE